jgi:hypothetical protein
MLEIKKNIGGRPKAIVLRDKTIKMRCTPIEKLMIEHLANSTGQTVADYCRSVALGNMPKCRLSEEEEQAYKTLAEYKTNFKRISNYIQNNQSVSTLVIALCKEIDKHLKKFTR